MRLWTIRRSLRRIGLQRAPSRASSVAKIVEAAAQVADDRRRGRPPWYAIQLPNRRAASQRLTAGSCASRIAAGGASRPNASRTACRSGVAPPGDHDAMRVVVEASVSRLDVAARSLRASAARHRDVPTRRSSRDPSSRRAAAAAATRRAHRGRPADRRPSARTARPRCSRAATTRRGRTAVPPRSDRSATTR